MSGGQARLSAGSGGVWQEVPFTKLKYRFPQVAKLWSTGATLCLTDYGKPIALLRAYQDGIAPEASPVAAAHQLRARPARKLEPLVTGETLVVTRSGERVALILPLPEADDPAQRLREAGKALPAAAPDVVYADLPGIAAKGDPSRALERTRRAFA